MTAHGYRISFALAALTLAELAHATQIITAAQVVSASALTSTGDVLVTMSVPISGCDALWLRKADTGFDPAYATVLLAKGSSSSATVTVDETSWWPGSSSGHFCKILAFRID